MLRYLLDTQVFVMLGRGDTYQKIGKKAQRALENEDSLLFLSCLSLVELAIKSSKDKPDFRFPLPRVYAMIERFDITVLDYTQAAATQYSELPPHHKDPFDRMLISTALVTEMPIIGSDSEFRKYKGLKLVWQ